MDWIQILGGAASAVIVLGALFGFANRYMLDQITAAVNAALAEFERALLKTLKEGYVSRAEYVLADEHGRETHGRHDKEIDQLWARINSSAKGAKA